jgi:hypothetical protein
MIYDKKLDVFRINGGYVSRVLLLEKAESVMEIIKQDLRITDDQLAQLVVLAKEETKRNEPPR